MMKQWDSPRHWQKHNHPYIWGKQVTAESVSRIELGFKMGPKLFRRFCDIAYEKSGITLKPGKEALVAARIAKRQRALGIPTAKAYLEYLESEDNEGELIFFLDAISTNYTHFFREKVHFDQLAEEVQFGICNGQKRLRIWSAASSTGEEPYSIIMTVLEVLERSDFDFRLLATDISTQVLAKAHAGVYMPPQLEPISQVLKTRYFDRCGARNTVDESFKIKESVKKYAVFKRLNLSTPPFPMPGPLDIIFCRNVMIYFDNSVRKRLVGEIERLLKPGGVLFIGHSETLTGISTGLQIERPSVYRKPHR
jgi:chemotaxis protein methyltransferase CheR